MASACEYGAGVGLRRRAIDLGRSWRDRLAERVAVRLGVDPRWGGEPSLLLDVEPEPPEPVSIPPRSIRTETLDDGFRRRPSIRQAPFPRVWAEAREGEHLRLYAHGLRELPDSQLRFLQKELHAHSVEGATVDLGGLPEGFEDARSVAEAAAEVLRSVLPPNQETEPPLEARVEVEARPRVLSIELIVRSERDPDGYPRGLVADAGMYGFRASNRDGAGRFMARCEPNAVSSHWVLPGPVRGRWFVAQLEVIFVVAGRAPYHVLLAGVELASGHGLELWRPPPRELFEV